MFTFNLIDVNIVSISKADKNTVNEYCFDDFKMLKNRLEIEGYKVVTNFN